MIHFYFWFRYRVGRKKEEYCKICNLFQLIGSQSRLNVQYIKRKVTFGGLIMKNIVKATTDARVRFCYQSNFLTEQQYFDYKFKTQTSKSWLNLASVTRQRLNIITSTKHRQQNTDQTSVSKSRRSFNFKILTKLCAQNLNKSLALWPNLSSKKTIMILP